MGTAASLPWRVGLASQGGGGRHWGVGSRAVGAEGDETGTNKRTQRSRPGRLESKWASGWVGAALFSWVLDLFVVSKTNQRVGWVPLDEIERRHFKLVFVGPMDKFQKETVPLG
jgi:hypothetical protein